MEEITQFTNEQNEQVTERVMQVYGLNINLPVEDETSNLFFNSLIEHTGVVPLVFENKLCIGGIHTNDALNVLMGCFGYCHTNGCNTMLLTSILSVMNTFRNMRVISFTFIENSGLKEEYEKLVDSNYTGNKNYIFEKVYNVTEMEMHLSDTLNKDVVEFLNKMFMFYSFIPNDYMQRRFCVEFEYDEYVNFMGMILSNNRELVSKLGIDVVNYLILFPVIVTKSKPKIRIVTNYVDL